MRLVISLIFALSAWAQSIEFLQKPYLQLGSSSKLSSNESAALLWHTLDIDAPWSSEVKIDGETEWRKQDVKMLRRIDVRGIAKHRVYQSTLTDLKPGQPFDYRVLLSGRPVFQSHGRARRPAGESHRIAIYGDMSQDSNGQKAVAYRIHQAQPEYLLSVGDVVYSRGLASEYYKKYFPIYNCEKATEGQCAPLLRSFPTVAVPGNHDTPSKIDLGVLPDALAYYYYWNQPLNGPIAGRDAGNQPEIRGSKAAVDEFYQTAPNFPQMGMFSFDYGDVHWTMLDSNSYVDWTDPKLREWVRQDLRSAKKAAWRFVAMHHPAFQSSRHHFDDQWMRLLADIFEEEGVDVVFAGHVHNYQRSAPLRFKVDAKQAATRPMIKGKIDGEFKIDRNFDGTAKTKPDGVIYLVTGAGGASLYDGAQENDPKSWQKYTVRFASSTHSFTSVDVSSERLLFLQIAGDGRELDRFTITR